MLENLGIKVEGQASAWLVKRVSDAADGLIDALFVGAALLWQSNGFRRAAEEEICCTVPFFGCCERVQELHPEMFSVLRIVYDAAQPDRDMLAGLTHPKRSPRPDLCVVFFGPVTIRIEAKMLALKQSLPKKYVLQGMKRFITGKYSSSPGQPSFMIGYVFRDDTELIMTKINDIILHSNSLSDTDKLTSMTEPLPVIRRYESDHANGVRLIHFVVDVRRN